MGRGSKLLSLGSLCIILLAIAILIAPTMQHRLVEAGQSTTRLIGATNRLAGLALLPLTIGLALSVYVVAQRTFGTAIGIAIAAVLGCASSFFCLGLEILVIGRHRGAAPMQPSTTPLKTEIEQLLTEARLIIPGGQALLGFQLIAMLTSGFDRLPEIAKVIHAVALCLVGLNVVIMMTPAALHRLSFGGEDSPQFFRLGSALVMTGPAFLAAGISAEIYVVFLKAVSSRHAALTASIASIMVLSGFWYFWPLTLRKSRRKAA